MAPVLTGLLVALPVGLLLVAATWVLRRQRDAARSETAAARRLLRDILDHDTAGIVVLTDAAGRVTQLSAGAEAALGVTEAEAAGDTPARFLDEGEIASWAMAMRTDPDFASVAAGLDASGQRQPIDWAYVRPDGERRLLSMTVSAVRDGSDRVTGYLCAGQDVTEQSWSGENGTEQFLATLGHELRTPMASILGYAEVLQEALADRPGAADLRDFVDRIDRNGARMLVLIKDLLTLTRVESPDLQLQPAEVDLRTVVSTVYDDLAGRLSDRRLDLSLRLPPDPVLHVCDTGLVQEVVTHLLTNAAKFTPDGGRVVVGLRSSGSVVKLVVSDTGLGISQTDQERLFSRFFRSHQAEVRQIHGSGLGLAIVQRAVGLHGGTVTVDSELGRGSTFVVELPCHVGDVERVDVPVGPPTMTA